MGNHENLRAVEEDFSPLSSDCPENGGGWREQCPRSGISGAGSRARLIGCSPRSTSTSSGAHPGMGQDGALGPADRRCVHWWGSCALRFLAASSWAVRAWHGDFDDGAPSVKEKRKETIFSVPARIEIYGEPAWRGRALPISPTPTRRFKSVPSSSLESPTATYSPFTRDS